MKWNVPYCVVLGLWIIASHGYSDISGGAWRGPDTIRLSRMDSLSWCLPNHPDDISSTTVSLYKNTSNLTQGKCLNSITKHIFLLYYIYMRNPHIRKVQYAVFSSWEWFSLMYRHITSWQVMVASNTCQHKFRPILYNMNFIYLNICS